MPQLRCWLWWMLWKLLRALARTLIYTLDPDLGCHHSHRDHESAAMVMAACHYHVGFSYRPILVILSPFSFNWCFLASSLIFLLASSTRFPHNLLFISPRSLAFCNCYPCALLTIIFFHIGSHHLSEPDSYQSAFLLCEQFESQVTKTIDWYNLIKNWKNKWLPKNNNTVMNFMRNNRKPNGEHKSI